MKERFVYGEYAYASKAEWEEAKKEEESVRYIRAKMNLKDTDIVYKLYCRLVDQGSFYTPVGIGFLQELRRQLLSGVKPPEEIPAIPIRLAKKKSVLAEEISDEEKKKIKNRADYYQGKLQTTRIVAVGLTFLVIVMFLITMFGPNSPLADANEQVQNQYAAWEQELTEREQAVREKENALGIQP